ncbi:receptor-like protein 6 [Prunus dulcis]|uniref:receptor-like protein 6 n=1 Tax=Prunus dulcis TaxID=3755 RepID=UPI0014821938|nr:receptor-like protein 6 [Prunus dulcis]
MLSKLVVVVVWFHLVVIANSLYSLQQQQPSCHDGESSALLQFMQSFMYPSASFYNGNCCSWDGVDCDEETGHVIGLDLSSSGLYGSINSNSSLFRLVHLQRLNLANNDFNYSQIPSSIRNFPRLTHLNLSASFFSGQVPSEVSHLSKLLSLDLSLNLDRFSGEKLLKLHPSNMRSLVQNLTSLEKLDLSYINISSIVPNSMANLSFLIFLALENCELFGEFPARTFKLQNLRHLNVEYNQGLTGYMPELNRSSLLMSLRLGYTRIFVNLRSITKLDLLQELDAPACNFSEGLVPASLGNLRQVTYLDISANKFGGPIPDSLANLTQLTHLLLQKNQFTGPIPPWLGNLTRLTHLNLDRNKLNSSIPKSLSNVMNLQRLHLYENRLSGTVEFHMFLKLHNLKELLLGYNNLYLLIESRTMNVTIPQFRSLGLGSCNLRGFPDFLRYQENLQWLGLHGNKIRGQVPKWIWNASTETLKYIDMSSNMLFGELPIPSPNVEYYQISNNLLTGQVSPLICSLRQLQLLDLSNNRLSGTLPQCLGNFSNGLQVLNLGNNSFHGILPQRYTMASRSNLRMIDVSHNQLQGQLPRSLANCVMLEFMVLSRNKFNDVFPLWLGTLPRLKFLAMDHNEFYDVIGKPQKNHHFLELHFLDLSYNNFTGPIPQGTQLTTFDSTSYEGNPGLCGGPLQNKCGVAKTPQQPPSSVEQNDSGSAGAFEFDWKFVLAGLGSGLVVGVVLADVAITRRKELFVKIVGMIRLMITKGESWE